MNRVFLFGNLGSDPELRATCGGTSVLKMRLATTESFVDRQGARRERTEWHTVTLFGRRADALARILTKGRRVLIEGALRTSSYEKDGEKRYSTEVIARDIMFAGCASAERERSRPHSDRVDGDDADPGDDVGEEYEADAEPPEDDDIPF